SPLSVHYRTWQSDCSMKNVVFRESFPKITRRKAAMPRFMGALTGNHLPAEAVMIGEATAVRSAKRMPVRLNARMSLESQDEGTRVAWVRDLYLDGVFLLSYFSHVFTNVVDYVLNI